jgi:uncharacterized repeat protein (TIGR03806 family)
MMDVSLHNTMKIRQLIVFIGVASIVWAGFVSRTVPTDAPLQRLSEYHFFEGTLSDLKPAKGVFDYEVNAPLFSDYAEKARFVHLPEGQAMTWDSSGVWQLPVGSTIIKSFYYYKDAGHPEAGRRIIETRLLLRQPNGWKALEYIWNADQTDATLEVAGATIPVEWRSADGKQQRLDYQVPNLNQCKGCHSYDGQFTPIGITARQLNRGVGVDNQTLKWARAGLLTLPSAYDPEQSARLTDYRDGQVPVAAAARAIVRIVTTRMGQPIRVVCFWRHQNSALND